MNELKQGAPWTFMDAVTLGCGFSFGVLALQLILILFGTIVFMVLMALGVGIGAVLPTMQ